MAWLPELPLTLVIPEAVTADVATGFVVDQVIVVLQLLAPDAMEQDGDEELMEPDITLFSEQDAVVPPLTPAQLQVQFVVLLRLLVLVPAVQL
jgi:hypothetical protein